MPPDAAAVDQPSKCHRPAGPRVLSWPRMPTADGAARENPKLGGNLGAVAATLAGPEHVPHPFPSRIIPRIPPDGADKDRDNNRSAHRQRHTGPGPAPGPAPPPPNKSATDSDDTGSSTSTLLLDDTSNASDASAGNPSRAQILGGVLINVPPRTGPASTLARQKLTEITLKYQLPQTPGRHSVKLSVGLPGTRVARIRDILAPQLEIDGLVARQQRSAASSEIHVFVDASNIVIGFYSTLVAKLGIARSARLSPPPAFDFPTLASILERGRTVAKAVAIGSMSPKHTHRPQYFDQAEAAGYRVDVRKRILSSSAAAAALDECHAGLRSRFSTREDRVDEAIHLQMSESLLDATEPRTIVLATGDAAAAEASGGFLKFVERALRLGWCVEVVSWTSSLSSAWRNKTWRRQWGGRFAIIELDDFALDLVATS